MWIKCNLSKTNYEPYLLNINTGAKIYIGTDKETDNNADYAIYRIYYYTPNSNKLFVLKSELIPTSYFADRLHYAMPLASEIDRLFEEIQKGKDFDFCY